MDNIDEEEYFDEELALSILLQNNILFCNERFFSSERNGKSEGSTIVLFVICNDVFGWACADAEDLPFNEIPILYKMWKKDNIWGSTKWCCLHRNKKPQLPVIEAMKKDGVWDESLDKLE